MDNLLKIVELRVYIEMKKRGRKEEVEETGECVDI
jgi:hypothetical protein